jgi:nicotinate-nucleotide adenylyltransferase
LTVNRLGVLGGSFNPVHLGHLHIARQSLELFDLSQVLFVVASVPPHKPLSGLISFQHRYAMVSLATSGTPAFVPSAIELEAPVSSYSKETLAKLARHFGVSGKALYFLAGGDSLLDVASWYDSAILLMSYNFVFVMRPGIEAKNLHAVLPSAAASRVVDCRGLEASSAHGKIALEAAAPECRIFLVDAGAPDIAASQIRGLLSRGQEIKNLVPASVCEYIQKLHLYGDR